jgi:aminoglycoside phosphotransferase (APT) family kinase protein
LFTAGLRWPDCYHNEIDGDVTQLWTEFIDGVSGGGLTPEMVERAALELGRFQGRLHTGQPEVLLNQTNLSKAEGAKNFYHHYRSWGEVYDYIRSGDCDIPGHLCRMIIETDEKSDGIWQKIEALPVVFCHRDFWNANIFYKDDEIVLIDWDTAGWGFIGEDIVSLVADEADPGNMVQYYNECTAAYVKGFSEFTDLSGFGDLFFHERIIMHFGYRIVEGVKFAKTPEEKKHNLNTLQKIYEMGENQS